MKVIRYLVLPILVLSGLVFLGYSILDEPLPEGAPTKEADELAVKMLESIADSSWQNTGVVQWEFVRGSKIHQHIWDRERNLAEVRFDNNVVQIDISNRTGAILNNADHLSYLQKAELCEKAWQIWANDSFWLNPVSKVFDPGTSRKIVNKNKDIPDLLVTYNSGGVTPGDSYLWQLDDGYRPMAWKIWASILPFGGMRFSWEQWTTLETGVFIATFHSGIVDIYINNVRGKSTLGELTGGIDIFTPLKDDPVQF